MKQFINKFFYSFGVLSFFAMCLYPVFSYFTEDKARFLDIKGIEITDFKRVSIDLLFLIFGSLILTFLINKRDKEKKNVDQP